MYSLQRSGKSKRPLQICGMSSGKEVKGLSLNLLAQYCGHEDHFFG